MEHTFDARAAEAATLLRCATTAVPPDLSRISEALSTAERLGSSLESSRTRTPAASLSAAGGLLDAVMASYPTLQTLERAAPTEVVRLLRGRSLRAGMALHRGLVRAQAAV